MELVRSINGKAVKRTDTKHTGMYSNTHTIKSIQGNLKNNQMTKDLAMQGSCIAKVVSIHSYPRDLGAGISRIGWISCQKKKKEN